jgi:hypothetical protein
MCKRKDGRWHLAELVHCGFPAGCNCGRSPRWRLLLLDDIVTRAISNGNGYLDLVFLHGLVGKPSEVFSGVMAKSRDQ